MKTRGFPRSWLALWALCFASCVAPIDAPSAFRGERYLCDPEHAAEFEAFIAPCREAHLRDRSCAGVMSFKGVIESQEMVMESQVVKAAYVDFPLADGTISRIVTLNGYSPYFGFRIDLGSFVVPPGVSKGGLVVDIDCSAMGVGSACASEELLNLEARGGNFLSQLVSQIRDIRLQTADELQVALTANLKRGGTLEGCFDVFPPPKP